MHWFAALLLPEYSLLTEPRNEKVPASGDFEDGSDGTRTRDLRRDRPRGRLPGQPEWPRDPGHPEELRRMVRRSEPGLHESSVVAGPMRAPCDAKARPSFGSRT